MFRVWCLFGFYVKILMLDVAILFNRGVQFKACRDFLLFKAVRG